MKKIYAYGLTILAVAAAAAASLLGTDAFLFPYLTNVTALFAVEAIASWLNYAKNKENFKPVLWFVVSAVALAVTLALVCTQSWFGLTVVLTVLFGAIAAFVLDLIVLIAVKLRRRG